MAGLEVPVSHIVQDVFQVTNWTSFVSFCSGINFTKFLRYISSECPSSTWFEPFGKLSVSLRLSCKLFAEFVSSREERFKDEFLQSKSIRFIFLTHNYR